MSTNHPIRSLAALLCGALLAGAAMAADVKELMVKPLPDYPT